jgi:hypothetical protein
MFILDLRVVVGSDSQHPTGGGSCGSWAGRLLVTTIGCDIKRHAEYAELVPAEYRERFGL